LISIATPSASWPLVALVAIHHFHRVYEPTSPDAKKWAQTAMVSFNQGQGLWGMGK
jgi:hypothetical protein